MTKNINLLRHNSFGLTGILFVLVLLLAACSAPSSGANLAARPTKDTLPAPTAEISRSTPSPTVATDPTPEKSSSRTPGDVSTISTVDEYGVSFNYDTILAGGVESQVKDAFTDDQGMNYLLMPQHLAFTFTDSYTSAEALSQRLQLNIQAMPQVVVYPADAYAEMHPLAKAQIEQLQILLAEQPAVPGGTLPHLPLNNAAQVFHSQAAYADFVNGSGIRYLTVFSQGIDLIKNQQLIYTFQGLTEDGEYYIAAFFPVTTDALHDEKQVEDWDAFSLNYPAYVAETKAMLNELSDSDFVPDLSLLDSIVASIQAKPEVELSGGGETVELYELGGYSPPGVFRIFDSEAGVYRLFQVMMDGKAQQLAENQYPLVPSPDALHAVYQDDDHRLWLVNLTDGSTRQLAEGKDISWLQSWGNASTLLLGVYLSAEEREGISTGHAATLNIENDELLVVEQEYVSLGRPAMAPDGQTIAYDISPFYSDAVGARVYTPEGVSQPMDMTTLKDLESAPECRLFNPSWSPRANQVAWLCAGEADMRLLVFDLALEDVMTIFEWQPLQFGALPPSPVWSADGKWLAIEIWANNEDESGLWIFPSDGVHPRLHAPNGRDPIWLNPSQLIYADLDDNMNGDIKIFDLDFRETGILDLPSGSQMLLVPPF